MEKSLKADFKCLLIYFILGAVFVRFASSELPYSAVIEKLEVVEVDDAYLKDVKVKVTKFNRTTFVINGSFEILKDAPQEIIANIIFYQKYGTEYKRGIDVPRVNLCEFLKNETKVYPALVMKSNLPRECPFVKNQIQINNFLINEELLPREVPPGNYWRIDTILTYQNHVIGSFKTFLHIQHNTPSLNALNNKNGL